MNVLVVIPLFAAAVVGDNTVPVEGLEMALLAPEPSDPLVDRLNAEKRRNEAACGAPVRGRQCDVLGYHQVLRDEYPWPAHIPLFQRNFMALRYILDLEVPLGTFQTEFECLEACQRQNENGCCLMEVVKNNFACEFYKEMNPGPVTTTSVDENNIIAADCSADGFTVNPRAPPAQTIPTNFRG